MATVTVYRWSSYDGEHDNMRWSRRWATKEAAEKIGRGVVDESTAVEIDASLIGREVPDDGGRLRSPRPGAGISANRRKGHAAGLMMDELPPEIIVLPAERFGSEWRFNLATGIYVDGCGGPCESGLLEATSARPGRARIRRGGDQPGCGRGA